MAYDSVNDYFVAYAAETGSVTESSDGTTAATLPTRPLVGAMTLVGYTGAVGLTRGLNNSIGYTAGKATGAYKKRGVLAPTVTINLTGAGALPFLEKMKRVSGVVPNICLFIGKPGAHTYCVRMAKINSAQFTLSEASEGEPREIGIQVEVMGAAYEVLEGGSAFNPTLSTLVAALNHPLFWHDVRGITITDGADADTEYRNVTSSATMTFSNNLIRKGERPYWGDDQPLSNTNYLLKEGLKTATGSLTLHDRLDEDLFTAIATAQNWGDVVFNISDSPVPFGGKTQSLTLTVSECTPTDSTQGEAAPGAQVTYEVPFAGFDWDLTQAVEDVVP